MTTRAILLIGLLSGGCLIVPAKKISTKPAGTEHGASTFVATKQVELSARADEGNVRVHAIRHGECTREAFAITEVTTDREAKLGGPDDPRARIFGVLLAPVLVPVSAIVTGLILASESATTTKQTHSLGTQRYACSQEAAQLAIQMTLPSGLAVHAVTDHHGDAAFEVPSSEPYVGSVTLTAQAADATQLAYALPRPAITVARDAVTECTGKHGVSGPVELKVSINGRGSPTRVWLSAGDAELARCVSTKLSGSRFPHKTWTRTIKLRMTVAPATASL